MTTEDKARELMVKERLADEERHEKMVSRAVEAEEAYPEKNLEETARELLTQERQHEEAIEDKMLHRAVENIQ